MADNKSPAPPFIPVGQWIPSYLTDVQRTWRKYGWVPPTEQRKGAK